MNENIVHIVNTEILQAHGVVMSKRKSIRLQQEEAQRIRIIAELTELYDAYNTFGSDYMTEIALKYYNEGEVSLALEVYRDVIQNTLASEITDVFLAALTLKMIRGEEPWKPKNQNRGETNTFMKMIKRVAEGMDADDVLDWCNAYASTYMVDLGIHLRLKIMYNEHRTDWNG